jgi:hypothetical protein
MDFLESLPFIGDFFKPKKVIVDTPVISTPIPSGSETLDTTPIVVLPESAISSTNQPAVTSGAAQNKS